MTLVMFSKNYDSWKQWSLTTLLLFA